MVAIEQSKKDKNNYYHVGFNESKKAYTVTRYYENNCKYYASKGILKEH
jgi:hypothetical protein